MTGDNQLQGQGSVVGKRAHDFVLEDHLGDEIILSDVCKTSPVMLVFYPGDFTPVCTKQLCNYQDNLSEFKRLGVRILGISSNSNKEHRKFASDYDFSFSLLSDPHKTVAKKYGCNSLMMFGGVSRAVFIVNTQMMILYRYVEPTILTRRKAEELISILRDLREIKAI